MDVDDNQTTTISLPISKWNELQNTISTIRDILADQDKNQETKSQSPLSGHCHTLCNLFASVKPNAQSPSSNDDSKTDDEIVSTIESDAYNVHINTPMTNDSKQLTDALMKHATVDVCHRSHTRTHDT